LPSYSLGERWSLGLMVRMYDGWARIRFSTRAPAEACDGCRDSQRGRTTRKTKTDLDLIARRRGSLLRSGIGAIGEDGVKEGVARGGDEVEEVTDEGVLVLVGHAGNGVEHVAGIVANEELGAAGVKVGVGGEAGAALDESVVGGGGVGVGGGGGVVEGGEDAGGGDGPR
jgi:hypothetical protein